MINLLSIYSGAELLALYPTDKFAWSMPGAGALADPSHKIKFYLGGLGEMFDVDERDDEIIIYNDREMLHSNNTSIHPVLFIKKKSV